MTGTMKKKPVDDSAMELEAKPRWQTSEKDRIVTIANAQYQQIDNFFELPYYIVSYFIRCTLLPKSHGHKP